MPERVRVVVRVRPFLPSDPDDADLTTLVVDDDHVSCGSQRVFRVDKVYKMEDDTDSVYTTSVQPIVADFLSGYNTTVMAYGQTGTGKTHTVSGLLPLIVGQIVNEGFHGNTEGLSFQYVEVYGDSLRDLLSSDPVGSAKNLQIYDRPAVTGGGGGGPPTNAGGGTPAGVNGVAGRAGSSTTTAPQGSFILGALRVSAKNLAEIYDIVACGTANRATGATNVHQHSSRSHSVFTIFNDAVGSKLHIVDLAGSERNKKTLNEGQRLQESIAINAGLLALGNVIRALSRNAQQGGAGGFSTASAAGHVPYRSSKLTRLLQDALGGTGKTLLITCVAPDSYNQDETLRSLQYCALAMKVLNTPIRQFGELRRRQTPQARLRDEEEENNAGGAGGRGELIPTLGLLSSPPTQQHDPEVLVEQLSMYKQFCDEQEQEIEAMRSRVTNLASQLEVCETELHKDEVIFTRQISEMERLVEENRALRSLLREQGCTVPSSTAAQMGMAAMGQGAARGAHGDPYASVDAEGGGGAHDAIGPHNSDGASPLESLKKTLPFLRRTLMASDVQREAPEDKSPLLAGPSVVASYQAEALRRQGLNAAAVPPRSSPDELSGAEQQDRDEHMLSLTKEALHYQRANTQLRHELRSMTVAMETQQREAAMMRLELDELQRMLR